MSSSRTFHTPVPLFPKGQIPQPSYRSPREPAIEMTPIQSTASNASSGCGPHCPPGCTGGASQSSYISPRETYGCGPNCPPGCTGGQPYRSPREVEMVAMPKANGCGPYCPPGCTGSYTQSAMSSMTMPHGIYPSALPAVLPIVKSRRLCRHFARGTCTWGMSCRFSHDIHEAIPEDEIEEEVSYTLGGYPVAQAVHEGIVITSVRQHQPYAPMWMHSPTPDVSKENESVPIPTGTVVSM